MSPEQAAAFVNAQTACAYAEIAAMQVCNDARIREGFTPAYDASAFLAVPDQFGIGHNAVLELFREANG